MNTACTPSQVMREGLDLNQQGHAGRQEQASSSSPEIFHGLLASSLAPSAARGDVTTLPENKQAAMDAGKMRCIAFFVLSLMAAILASKCGPGKRRLELSGL